ncbi:MAG: DsrE family protein [Dehalococcoidia bacterium]|nr:DsrE family protein [Dehalococcoidia bacterium]
MRVLLVVNDAPYGSEKAYNALRLAMTLQKEHAGVEVRVFLLADAVACALPGQATPQGYYNLGRMFRAVINKGAQVKACGSCVEARGLKGLDFIEGIEVSTMGQLAQWVVDADKVLTF